MSGIGATSSAGSSYYALEVNIMLVSLVLMEKIGVSGEVQRRAVGSRYFFGHHQEVQPDPAGRVALAGTSNGSVLYA
jgi:hypothetical protein